MRREGEDIVLTGIEAANYILLSRVSPKVKEELDEKLRENERLVLEFENLGGENEA
ncbi:MAG: hypothetical protein GY765_20710 [bacterium]|nr:hypothetical protein [bacterium]